MTDFFSCDKVAKKKVKAIKNYYVFVCLDGVPILELFLNNKRKAIEQTEKIDWMTVKYIILDFKSFSLKGHSVIEKGKVMHHEKMLTNQFIYYRIDLKKSHENIKGRKEKSFPKKEWNIMNFAEVMFHQESNQFIKYVKEREILKKKDILNLEKSLKILKKEQQILNSWKYQKIEEKK